MQYLKKSLLAAVCTTLAASAGAAYAPLSPMPGHDISRFAWKGEMKGLFNTVRDQKIRKLNNMLAGVQKAPHAAEIKPDVTLPAVEMLGDLDGPDGRLWFYTAAYDYDEEVVSEYYTKKIIKEYAFTIFDADLNEIGTVKDKVTYAEDETGSPQCILAPVVTRNYFNSDDKYEVIVGLTVNTEKYINRDYSIVYSIGGEKTTEGYDKPVTTLNMLIGDVLNASNGNEENVYITFMIDDNEELSDKDYDNLDPDDPDTMGFWEMITSQGMRLETYGKAGADGKLQKLWERRLRLCDLPGDQENDPFFFSLMNEGKPYFVFAHYADSYFAPYYDFMAESEMREGNELVIEVLTPENGALKEVQTTKVPTRLHRDVNDMVLCSFYSVGSMLYRDDVIFNKESGKIDFVLYLAHELSGTEAIISSYAVYDHEGNEKYKIFENGQGFIPISDVEGRDPQGMFVTTDINGNYIFNFVNLTNGKTEMSTSYKMALDEISDPEAVTSNLDRVKIGDKVMYAAELSRPGQDEDANDIMRIIWFHEDGKVDRIDEVNMGQGVFYAQAYIAQSALNPALFDADDKHEYMILVKRGYEDESGNEQKKEELMVCQTMNPDSPEGKTLLQLAPGERGDLNNIALYAEGDHPVLFVTYKQRKGNTDYYAQDYYFLPFGTGAAVSELPDASSSIAFDGSSVAAEGEIEIYNLQGMKVKAANGSASVADLSAGIYIVRANGETIKINVK